MPRNYILEILQLQLALAQLKESAALESFQQLKESGVVPQVAVDQARYKAGKKTILRQLAQVRVDEELARLQVELDPSLP